MLARVPTAFLLFLLLTSGAVGQNSGTAADKRQYDYDVRLSGVDKCRAAAQIDSRKPIGEFDAYTLAWAYFVSHINGCGFPELPKDAGDHWIAQTRVGIGGQPGPPIIIEKAGGATHSPGKQKVATPKDFVRFAKNI